MKSRSFDRYLTGPEERKLLRTVGAFGNVLARRDHAWMRVLRQTGVRITAFSRLTVADAQAAIREHRLELAGAIQKGKREHGMHVTRKARRAFSDLLRVRKEMGATPDPDGPLVMSRKHQRMSVRSFQARLRYWGAQAGISVPVSPHWFRHTLAKRLIDASTSQDPLGVVQAALGHASRNSSAIYAAPDREQVAMDLERAS